MSNNKLDRNAPCWCNSGKKYKYCHAAFDEKLSYFRKRGALIPSRNIIKTKEQLDGIKESGKRNIAVLDFIASNIKPGMSTEEIDRLVYEETSRLGGIPAPLNYHGFPKSVCTSINDEVCHGIPSPKVTLKDGDIVNVDVSTIYNGYFSDSSRMFCIGDVSKEKQELVAVAKECVEVGIQHVIPWTPMGNMGYAVHQHAIKNGYTIVRDIGGHGVGLEFHEDPFVSYVTKKGKEMLMVPGMVFTIEPMVNMGKDSVWEDAENGWTIYTDDGLPSAQWEVTVAVTDDGYEILAY